LKITLNGDPLELAGPVTVSELLAQLAIDGRRVAIEHNLTVLKRAAFDTVEIRDGDQVEIVNFVGGGATEQKVLWTTSTLPARPSPRASS
jgi:thiazole synthase